MATRIAFSGGDSLVVTEDLDDVVRALEGHAADTPALPCFTRADEDAGPVHVRPAAILYLTRA